MMLSTLTQWIVVLWTLLIWVSPQISQNETLQKKEESLPITQSAYATIKAYQDTRKAQKEAFELSNDVDALLKEAGEDSSSIKWFEHNFWKKKSSKPIKKTPRKASIPLNKKTINNLFYYGFKDDMFTYHNGVWGDVKWFTWVSYNQKRDLEDRDFIDVDQAFPEWVDLSLKDKEVWETYYDEATKTSYPYYKISWWNKFLFLFVHWLNWNATWWFKDWTFNGNFNRLKHIAYYNKGTYISPTIKNFNNWAKAFWRYIINYKKQNPNAKIFIACWSSWGETCWKIYDDINIPLDWIMMLGSMPPFLWMKSALKRNIPIYYGHWEKDRAMPMSWSINTYLNLKKNGKKVKLEVFTNGVHWTPLRMVDYLSVLRWMVQEEHIKGKDKSIWLPPSQTTPIKVKEVFPEIKK